MKTHQFIFCVLAFVCCRQYATAQVNYSANDAGRVIPYNTPFLYGTNGGYYDASWDDESLADIAAGNPSKNVIGAGAGTFRPQLPDNFVSYWGYDIRLDQYKYYASLGVRDNTVMLGGDPSPDHRDTTHYGGCSRPSYVFKNLYEPIWDNGANGTPVNENNYFASYVYQVVTRYKSYVKFWEIVNEPDYSSSAHSWYGKGQEGNWWENNPAPCDLDNLNAPIFYYIRMLRIAYQVIKSIDPTAYVAPGGVGYVSFVDALTRNTDNPVDGSVTADYPQKGGAWFDVLSFHSYPMWTLKTWNNSINNFIWRRHSDAAADEFVSLKKGMDSVLALHGYNGTTYPKKIFICTETNIPSQPFGDLLGSPEAQRNYVIKALVQSQQIGVRQTYVFETGNEAPAATASMFDVMGLFENLNGIGPLTNNGAYLQKFTGQGIAFKTCSEQLRDFHYDSALTAKMQLPATIGGGGFTDAIGTHTFVLWARTATDNSESGSTTYSFPAAMTVAPKMYQRNWDYSMTKSTLNITSASVALTGSPVFITENFSILQLSDSLMYGHVPVDNKFAVTVFPNPAVSHASLQFTLTSPETVKLDLYNTTGQWVATAIAAEKFSTGTHSVPLRDVARLNPGVYYCRFATGKTQIIKKLVIVR